MTRKLKALGLVLVGILALVALAAASGWAGEEEEGGPKMFKAAEEPVFLTGQQTEITNSWTTTKGETVCNNAHYTGTMKNKEEKELTIVPSYTEGCKTFNLPSHFEFNGCEYLFTLKKGIIVTEGDTTHTEGPMHIKCPPGKQIVINVTNESTTFCTIKVPAQTPTSPEVDTKNIGKGAGEIREVLFTSTIEGIHYEVTGGFGFCGQTGKTLTDGKLDSVMTVAAYKDENNGTKKGAQVAFRVIGS